MINHARTLLLNRDGNARPEPTFFLEEYVDPDFRALELPFNLASIANVLIGSQADDYYANYRLWQYMKMLHSTDLVSYVYQLDPRVTYLKDRSAIFSFSAPKGVLLAGTDSDLYFMGEILTAGSVRISYEWILEIMSSTVARTYDVKNSSHPVDSLYTVTDGLSSPIDMAGQQDLKVQVRSPVVGSRWLIQSLAAPSDDLTVVLSRIRGIGGGFVDALFRGGSPYDGFKKIWTDYPHIQMVLSAFLLAYIYRVEEVRLNA